MNLSGAELEKAALRSLSEVEFVGVTEHLGELYSHVAEAVWSLRELPLLGRENSSPDRPRRSNVSAALVRRIEEMTSVDQAIYEAALRRAPKRMPPG